MPIGLIESTVEVFPNFFFPCKFDRSRLKAESPPLGTFRNLRSNGIHAASSIARPRPSACTRCIACDKIPAFARTSSIGCRRPRDDGVDDDCVDDDARDRGADSENLSRENAG